MERLTVVPLDSNKPFLFSPPPRFFRSANLVKSPHRRIIVSLVELGLTFQRVTLFSWKNFLSPSPFSFSEKEDPSPFGGLRASFSPPPLQLTNF